MQYGEKPHTVNSSLMPLKSMVQQEPKLGLLLLSLVEPSRGNQFTKGMAMGSSILAYVNTALAQEISGLEFSTWAQPHVQCFGR